ncbi:hypothetical protein J5N97_003045 [Dioscorea zingiberensis]|uniref:Uncharacterized protein n=1 Tax=Dioscorea zingiberensis TaxID=325984 RepID=A0A9D5D4W0_9LILI|nr:hypothetical protein J5N97_003045 [Dioscorea zingiberensis]
MVACSQELKICHRRGLPAIRGGRRGLAVLVLAEAWPAAEKGGGKGCNSPGRGTRRRRWLSARTEAAQVVRGGASREQGRTSSGRSRPGVSGSAPGRRWKR